MLDHEKGKKCIIGIGQHYNLYFGTNKFRNKSEKSALSGQVTYQEGIRTYTNSFNVVFDSYAIFFSVNSDAKDFLKEMKAQTNELMSIKEALQQLIANQQTDSESMEEMSE